MQAVNNVHLFQTWYGKKNSKNETDLGNWGCDCFWCICVTGIPLHWGTNIWKEILKLINTITWEKHMKSKGFSPLPFFNFWHICEVCVSVKCFTVLW